MDADRAAIADALDRWLAGGCPRAEAGWGAAAAEPAATVSGSTRIVLGVGGRNRMRIPSGDGVREILLRPREAVLVDRLAWNRPLHAHPFAFLTIDLQRDYLRYYLRRQARTGMEPARVTALFLRGGPDRALRSAADTAEALVGAGDSEGLRLAVLLTVRCARRLLQRPLLRDDPAWTRLREWIEERLHEPDLGRDDAARACGMHPGHASRVVARATGMGFAAWVAERRCARARDLLAGGGLPVAEIGRRCGFASAAYFNHAFRASSGCSPGRWRTGLSQPGADMLAGGGQRPTTPA